MKIAMTMVVRDEMDIIEANLHYNLPKVDLMIVMDNASIDGTTELLESMDEPKLIVMHESKHNHQQYVNVWKMAQVARAKGAEWVAHIDADEFLFGDLRAEIERQADGGFNCFDIPWCTFYPTWRDDPTELCVPRGILWRVTEYERDSKVVHAIRGFQEISQGNHVVFMQDKNSAGRSTSLEMFHFPNRGWKYWREKMIRGGQAYERQASERDNLPDYMGKHKRDAYKAYKRWGDEALYKIWCETMARDDEDLKRMGLILDMRLASEFGLDHYDALDRSTAVEK